MSHNEPRQRRQNLGGTSAASPYFTSVGGGGMPSPPPPPPPPRANYQQYSTTGSVNSSTGSYGSNASSPYGSYGHAAAPSSPYAAAASTTPTTATTTTSHHSSEVKIHPRANINTQSSRGGGCSGGTVFVLWLLWTALLAGGAYYYETHLQGPHRQRQLDRMQSRHALELETLATERDRTQKSVVAQQVQRAVEQAEQRHRTALDEQRRAERESQKRATEWQIQVQKEQRANQQLQRELQELQSQSGGSGNGADVVALQRRIQEQSKKWVLQRYGPGPHRVEFEVRFPNEDNSWYIIVELAPLELMPHTTHVFLQQMEQGLFMQAKVSFHHNGPHMILAEPVPNFATPHELWHNEHDGEPNEQALADIFANSGYDQVLFQEYSPDYPHDKYTLGLSRRAFDDHHSGPGFYVNTQDNIASHGPGGYASDGTGDPCFGKIVNGQDIIERIHAASGVLQEGDWKAMEHGNIALMSVHYIHPR